jgi:hypothetical protein
VKLESWQEDEATQLNDRLTKELEMLVAYQGRQRINLETSCDRERAHLQEKIALRKAVLEQKVNTRSARCYGEIVDE